MHPIPLLLVGTGPMAIEYAKVLKSLNQSVTVVGRSDASAKLFQETTGVLALSGGLSHWLTSQPVPPAKAMVVVTENELGNATLELLKHGCREILVEKPGAANIPQILEVAQIAKQRNAMVYVGYNRRFYTSVKRAEEIIAKDNGVTSFNFEFTEWGHVITSLPKAPGVKEEWFLHNSTHVIDLAFYVAGFPKLLSSYTTGSLPWHSSASIFAGAGISKNGAPFSYQANWEAPGRWGVEFLTRKHRLILRPMEKLQIQQIGSVAIEEVPIDDILDTSFKPGLHGQITSFLGDKKRLCTIDDQVDHTHHFKMIVSGSSIKSKL